jgi:SAM-dependent methyltransferase
MSIYAAAKWEAPDRSFFGHRDCMVRNMSRYHFIAPQVKGRCLDIGCGRGYGFDYLKPKCTSCTGLDISETFLEEARAQYPDVAFVHQSAEKLPFSNASFDTITSFEVIEHIQDDNAFLREITRVGAPGAVVAVSTPNRLIASGDRKKPLNKFHVREYVAEEFHSLLESVFAEVMLYGQSDGRGGETSSTGLANSLMDRIPVRMKYLIPFYVQDMLSVMLRPSLKIEDCRFDLNKFQQAHTLYAVCRLPV